MTDIRVNLFSDTQTKPSEAMRRAMAAAEVGDEQQDLDPTVNRLCDMVAELLGKPAAVFLPSGTMCNEIAVLAHCRPGEEIIAHKTSHILNFEGGAPAALAGAQIMPLDGARGMFTGDAVAAAVRPGDRYSPVSRMVAVEQTANLGGGAVWPLADLAAVAEVARANGLVLHMDGARLMNAAVASGEPAAAHAAPFDSVWIDLSKGLGCPVGAVLAGSRDFIDEAWRWKQRIGGAMRQAGILAAAGVYALEHNVDRLADDHANARRFAESIAGIDGVGVAPDTVETNMVFFDVGETGLSAAALQDRLAAEGVRMSTMGPTRMRAVTHLDVGRDDVDAAAAAVRRVLDGGGN